MTTKNKSRIMGSLLSIFIASSSFAQTSVKTFQPVITNDLYAKVYENVKTEFNKKFSKAENVKWDYVGKNFLAKFSMGDLKYRVLLNPKGRVVYKNTYGNEKLLPVHIRKEVKRNYVEYLITAAVLVEEANRSIWIINLEDESNYVVVRVEKDEIEEVKQYDKTL